MKEVSPHPEADGSAMHPPTTGSGWGCGFSLPLGLEAIKNVRLGNKHPSFPPFRGEKDRFMSPPVPRKKERKSDVTKSCPTLCDPMDCSLPGSSIQDIFQARILVWVAISFSRGIFLTQGSNLGLLHCRQTFYGLNHQALQSGPQQDIS